MANLNYTAAEINEKLDNAVTEYPAAANLPSAAAKVGIRHALAENILSISNGTVESKVAMLNQDGDLIANIIPRTGTLAQLQAIVGDQGEIASPTDVSGIFKFKGNGLPGGELIKSSGKSVTQSKKALKAYGLNAILGATPASYALFSAQTFGDTPYNMYVARASGTSMYYTINGGVDWHKLPDISGNPTINGIYIAGDRIFASGLGTVYVCAPLGSATGASWAQITLDAAFAAIYPIVWAFEEGTVLIGGFTAGSSTLQLHYINSRTGTTAGALETFPIAATLPSFAANTRILHGVAGVSPEVIFFMPGEKTSLYYKNYDNGGAWTSIPMPAGVTAIESFDITEDTLIVQYLSGGLYRFARSKITWAGEGTGAIEISPYETLTFTSTNLRTMLANLSTIFLIDPVSKVVSLSLDSGDTFTTIPPDLLLKNTTSNSILTPCIHESGIIFRTSNSITVNIVFVSNDGDVSSSYILPSALTSPSFFGLFRLRGSVFPWLNRIISIDNDAIERKAMSTRQTTAGNITIAGDTFTSMARGGVAVTFATAQTAIDLNLPAQPFDLMTVQVYFKSTVTTLTIKPPANDSATIVNGVGTNVSGGGATLTVSNIVANQMIRLTYFLTTNEWILG